MLVQLIYLAFFTPIAFDFYNYDMEKPEFVLLFSRFIQVCFYVLYLISLVKTYATLTSFMMN